MDLKTMKNHAVSFFSLITLLSIFSACYGHQNPEAPEAANDGTEVQKLSAAEAITAGTQIQKPSAETADDNLEIQKPSEAAAIDAAIAYLNRDGQLTIQKSEFLKWGTFNEKQVYWPMKLRITYRTNGSDTQRQNEYAVKISKDINGKLKADTYYAWRTDFK